MKNSRKRWKPVIGRSSRSTKREKRPMHGRSSIKNRAELNTDHGRFDLPVVADSGGDKTGRQLYSPLPAATPVITLIPQEHLPQLILQVCHRNKPEILSILQGGRAQKICRIPISVTSSASLSLPATPATTTSSSWVSVSLMGSGSPITPFLPKMR